MRSTGPQDTTNWRYRRKGMVDEVERAKIEHLFFVIKRVFSNHFGITDDINAEMRYLFRPSIIQTACSCDLATALSVCNTISRSNALKLTRRSSMPRPEFDRPHTSTACLSSLA